MLQLLGGATDCAAIPVLLEAAEEKKLRSGVAGCAALLHLLGGSALSELLGTAEEARLRSEVADRSALLELLGDSALPELLGSAENKHRFMAQ